jgi:dsDNA-binding SOS-regulon protein
MTDKRTTEEIAREISESQPYLNTQQVYLKVKKALDAKRSLIAEKDKVIESLIKRSDSYQADAEKAEAKVVRLQEEIKLITAPQEADSFGIMLKEKDSQIKRLEEAQDKLVKELKETLGQFIAIIETGLYEVGPTLIDRAKKIIREGKSALKKVVNP